MSKSSDQTKASPARSIRSRLRRLLTAALILLAVSIGGVVLWETYGGVDASSQTATTEMAIATPAAMETSEGSQAATQLLKELQISQQQTADKLEDIQRQLASEQGERKLLSEQLAALSSRVNALSASNASA